jgi:hypothetical protein
VYVRKYAPSFSRNVIILLISRAA